MPAASPAAPPRAAKEAETGDDYFSRVIPEPFQILGLRLLPLSLGRYRLLKRFNVAFVSDNSATPTLDDLLLGVLICSMRCDEFLAFIEQPEFNDRIADWARKCGLFNLVEKTALFQKYLKAAERIPEYRLREPSERKSGTHWSQSLEVTLRGELNWTESEINEAPLSKALADYFAHAERQGTVILYAPGELDAMRAQAAHNDARVAAAQPEAG